MCPAITQTFPLSNDNSPDTSNLTDTIYCDLLLSEHYGKNIRQGQMFVITGAQASIRPANFDQGAGIDVGLSAAVKLEHHPVTRHSRKAWNMVFKQWRGQKALSGKVGAGVRNDDMEFCWTAGQQEAGRTSTIYGQGLPSVTEDMTEYLTLNGDSSQGTDFSLRDYYNSAFPAPAASRDHFDNTTVKSDKYGGSPYPNNLATWIHAYNSAAGDFADFNEFSSAASAGPINEFPEPLRVLCGLVQVNAYVMPDDTLSQIEEDMELVVTLFVKSWAPLVYRKPRSRKQASKSKARWVGRKSKTTRRGRGG